MYFRTDVVFYYWWYGHKTSYSKSWTSIGLYTIIIQLSFFFFCLVKCWRILLISLGWRTKWKDHVFLTVREVFLYPLAMQISMNAMKLNPFYYCRNMSNSKKKILLMLKSRSSVSEQKVQRVQFKWLLHIYIGCHKLGSFTGFGVLFRLY